MRDLQSLPKPTVKAAAAAVLAFVGLIALYDGRAVSLRTASVPSVPAHQPGLNTHVVKNLANRFGRAAYFSDVQVINPALLVLPVADSARRYLVVGRAPEHFVPTHKSNHTPASSLQACFLPSPLGLDGGWTSISCASTPQQLMLAPPFGSPIGGQCCTSSARRRYRLTLPSDHADV